MTLRALTRRLSQAEFDRLPQPQQIEVLNGVDARQKSRYLLAADNGEQLVAAMPSQSVYLMVKEIGIDQLPDLVNMATGSQWTAFFDLDCWLRDQFDSTKARAWLAVLNEAEEEQVLALLDAIDFEVLILLFKHEVAVVAGPDDPDDENRQEETLTTGGYQLEFRDEPGARLFGRLLSILLHNDPDFYREVLEAIRANTLISLEENVYQRRAVRMMDMGFPEPFSARAVYAWVAPDTFAESRDRKLVLGLTDFGAAPGFPLVLSKARGLLAALFEQGLDNDQAWELANLVNKVALADGIDIGEIDAMRQVSQKVGDNLNLAIEWLAGEDHDLAGSVLRQHYLQELFQLGHSLTLRLQRRAGRLAQSTIGPYLDPPYQAIVTALLQPRPQFFVGLEDATRAGERAFVHARDLARVENALTQLDVQRHLFETCFDFALPRVETLDVAEASFGPAGEPALSDFFLTALANRLLGRSFHPDPLTVGDVARLQQIAASDGHLNAALLDETCAWLETLVPGGGQFGRFCLAIWNEGLCAVAPQVLDPRYLNGFISRLKIQNA